MSLYTFTLTETQLGVSDHDNYPTRRRLAQDVARRFRINPTPKGEPNDQPAPQGSPWSYVWTVDAPDFESVKALCQYFVTQQFVTVTAGPTPALTIKEAATVKELVDKMIADAKTNQGVAY